MIDNLDFSGSLFPVIGIFFSDGRDWSELSRSVLYFICLPLQIACCILHEVPVEFGLFVRHLIGALILACSFRLFDRCELTFEGSD
jgi:hypothetical protein